MGNLELFGANAPRRYKKVPTPDDAAIIKGMLLRGDNQHDVAAWFGFNQGRIFEVKNGTRHPEVSAAPADQLPPPGPYGRHRAR
jgi:hypothetical protein